MKKKKVLIGGISFAIVALLAIAIIGYPPFNAFCNAKKSSKANFPGFGIWLPPDYEVHGIDVSRHQGRINWDAVSEHTSNDIGISFAFIKACEGRTVRDNYFMKIGEVPKILIC